MYIYSSTKVLMIILISETTRADEDVLYGGPDNRMGLLLALPTFLSGPHTFIILVTHICQSSTWKIDLAGPYKTSILLPSYIHHYNIIVGSQCFAKLTLCKLLQRHENVMLPFSLVSQFCSHNQILFWTSSSEHELEWFWKKELDNLDYPVSHLMGDKSGKHIWKTENYS